LIMLGTVFLA